jgi:catechol-2,3-dioxygenase
MATLRHLAILTHQPDKLAQFYQTVFDIEALHRTEKDSVPLSDGNVNLATLNSKDLKDSGHQSGLYHFGFLVDNMRTVSRRIQELHPDDTPRQHKTTYAESRGMDPDGNLFDLSTCGYNTKPRPRKKGEQKIKGLRC